LGGSRYLESIQNLADSDIVIYYLHGGGYAAFSLSNYLPFLLAIWESMKTLKPNAIVSIFALKYDVAPAVQFPGQLARPSSDGI